MFYKDVVMLGALRFGSGSSQIGFNSSGTLTTGQVNLSSTGSNSIKFDNSGVGPPTATTRSAGTKLTFYSELSTGLAEYATGVDAYTLWNSVPSTSPFQFQWLGALQ